MKNRWKHIFIPVLTMALCLSLAACGSGDVTGADWRTTGVVVGSGIITHDGESGDVLVTVSESSAAFYRDMPEQVLFDSVTSTSTLSPSWVMVPLSTTAPLARQSSPAVSSDLPQAAGLRHSASASAEAIRCLHRCFMILSFLSVSLSDGKCSCRHAIF